MANKLNGKNLQAKVESKEQEQPGIHGSRKKTESTTPSYQPSSQNIQDSGGSGQDDDSSFDVKDKSRTQAEGPGGVPEVDYDNEEPESEEFALTPREQVCDVEQHYEIPVDNEKAKQVAFSSSVQNSEENGDNTKAIQGAMSVRHDGSLVELNSGKRAANAKEDSNHLQNKEALLENERDERRPAEKQEAVEALQMQQCVKLAGNTECTSSVWPTVNIESISANKVTAEIGNDGDTNPQSGVAISEPRSTNNTATATEEQEEPIYEEIPGSSSPNSQNNADASEPEYLTILPSPAECSYEGEQGVHPCWTRKFFLGSVLSGVCVLGIVIVLSVLLTSKNDHAPPQTEVSTQVTYNNSVKNGTQCTVRVKWPGGKYGLPKANSECPAGTTFTWKTGWRKQHTKQTKQAEDHSVEFHLGSIVGKNTVTRHFCIKTNVTGDSERPLWPKGQYCIYRKGDTCPKGLSDGRIKWDDVDGGNMNSVGGTLPDGKYDMDTVMYFCCRTDGDKDVPVTLPTAAPFHLLASGSATCQQVKFALASEEWLHFHTEGKTSKNEYGGTHPYGANLAGHTMHYCYYTSCKYTLNENWGTFKSPNYPCGYPNGQYCSWKISVRSGFKIVLRFPLFALQSNSTADNVQVFDGVDDAATSLGVFSGNHTPPSTGVVSFSNNVFVIFKSNASKRNKGFIATYTSQYNTTTSFNECSGNPCQHGGSCTDQLNGYTCNCTANFTGTICQSSVFADFDLKFPRRGTTDYVIYRGVPSMRAVTVCFWMKTADKTNAGSPVSYAVPESNNEINIYDYKSFIICIEHGNARTHVAANDGKWHHICATWENTAGSWVLYKDGQAEANGTGLSKGRVIRGGGALILGQEQDSVEGNFEIFQSFIGELSGVNLWSRALVSREISKMSAVCTATDGDVFKWRDAIAGIRGDVQVIRPSSFKE